MYNKNHIEKVKVCNLSHILPFGWSDWIDDVIFRDFQFDTSEDSLHMLVNPTTLKEHFQNILEGEDEVEENDEEEQEEVAEFYAILDQLDQDSVLINLD